MTHRNHHAHPPSIFYVKPSQDKAIVITGCDSGFGRTLALKLGQKGFKVYACCLTQRAADELKKGVRLGLCMVLPWLRGREAHTPFIFGDRTVGRRHTQCEALLPLVVDVTKEEQVLAVADKIDKENPQGIFALVNNAGALPWMPAHCLCVVKTLT